MLVKTCDKRLEFVTPCGVGPYMRQKNCSSVAPMKFRVVVLGWPLTGDSGCNQVFEVSFTNEKDIIPDGTGDYRKGLFLGGADSCNTGKGSPGVCAENLSCGK